MKFHRELGLGCGAGRDGHIYLCQPELAALYRSPTAQDALGRKVWELLPEPHAPEGAARTGKPVLAQVVGPESPRSPIISRGWTPTQGYRRFLSM